MNNNQLVILVESSDGRAKMVFRVVNIVSSQNIAHVDVNADHQSSSSSIHMRGSKLQDDMMDFRSPKNKGQTVLHFPSTGATNVTVSKTFHERFQASLNYMLHSRLTWNRKGSVALSFSTNNLNHSGKLYGVVGNHQAKSQLLTNETHIVDANDKFPSIKFSIPYKNFVKKFQLFVPSFKCNTQNQTKDSLQHTGRIFLDILLRHIDFDSSLCFRCVDAEMKKIKEGGSKLDESEEKQLLNVDK